MPVFHCPICNFKTTSEKDEKEHAMTHKTPSGIENKKPDGKTKPADFLFYPRFLHKMVAIVLMNSSTISGKLTGFSVYEIMLDDKILIPKHAVLTLQEAETSK